MIGYYQFRFLTTKFSSCSWESGRSWPSMEKTAAYLGQSTAFFVKYQMGRSTLEALFSLSLKQSL